MAPLAEDEEMLRMSFAGHLIELRARIIKALPGLGAAFAIGLTFTDPLRRFICRPSAQALRSPGYPPQLYVFDPMDRFQIIRVKLPMVWAIFPGSPWVLYQLWAFIAPGRYRHERRWAAPLIIGLTASSSCLASPKSEFDPAGAPGNLLPDLGECSARCRRGFRTAGAGFSAHGARRGHTAISGAAEPVCDHRDRHPGGGGRRR